MLNDIFKFYLKAFILFAFLFTLTLTSKSQPANSNSNTVNVNSNVNATPQTSPTSQNSPTVQSSPQKTESPKVSETEKDSSWGKLIIPELWKWGIIIVVIVLIIILRKPLKHFIERVLNDASTVKVGLSGAELHIPEKSKPEEKKVEMIEEKAQPVASQDETTKSSGDKSDSLKIENEPSEDSKLDLFEIDEKSENLEELEQGFKKLQSSETDEFKKLENEGLYLFLRYFKGDSDALEKLITFAKREEISCHAYHLIGHIYAGYNLNKAVESYELSLKYCKKDEERAYRISSIAEVLHKFGKKDDAFKRLLDEINQTKSTVILVKLYTTLASLYKTDKKDWLRTLALEKAVELKPTDTDLLFSLAYAYANNKQRHLSILHYSKILNIEPKNEIVLNNQGVNYDNLELPIFAVRAYKKAEELEYTLASSNLANRLIDAGFAEEATKVLNTAKDKEDFHPNVGTSIATLAGKIKNEETEVNELRQLAFEQQQFFRKYAEEYFSTNTVNIDLSGVWIIEDGSETTITQKGDEIEFFVGSQFKYTGTIKNTIISVGRSKSEYNYYSKTSEYKFDKGGRAYISNDGNQIDMLISGDDSPKDSSPLMKLTRKPLDADTKNETPDAESQKVESLSKSTV